MAKHILHNFHRTGQQKDGSVQERERESAHRDRRAWLKRETENYEFKTIQHRAHTMADVKLFYASNIKTWK